jgi:hypothetical protein
MPAVLPASSATASRYQVLLSLVWRSPPDDNHFVVETLSCLFFCRHLLQEYGDTVLILWYYALPTSYVGEYVGLLGLQNLPFFTTSYDPVEAFTPDLIVLPFCYPRDPRTVLYNDPAAWYLLRQDWQALRPAALARLPNDAAPRQTVIYANCRDVTRSIGGVRVASGAAALCRPRPGRQEHHQPLPQYPPRHWPARWGFCQYRVLCSRHGAVGISAGLAPDTVLLSHRGLSRPALLARPRIATVRRGTPWQSSDELLRILDAIQALEEK